jgi:hypothetical protein
LIVIGSHVSAGFFDLGEHAMFGTKRRRAEQQAAQQQQQQAVKDAAPTADETELAAERKAWRDDKASSKDVVEYAAMKPYLGLADAARERQTQDRQGTGILNLASRMNPAQAANYKIYTEAKRQQDAAMRLEDAYNMTDANMRGDAYTGMQIANNRNLGKLSALNQAMAIQYQRPSTMQELGSILGPIVQGAGMVAKAF